MNCPYCIKVCTKCKRLLVAYNGNFFKKKGGKYGVASQCKTCFSNYHKNRYEENREEILRKNKEYRENNIEKEKERHKRYVEQNKEIVKEKRQKYYKKNRERILEQTKKYHYEHIDYYNEYSRNYYRQHPEKNLNNKAKRRARENLQGDGITSEQWKEMFDYFDWKCAYSDKYIGGNSKYRTVDHIVPLYNNGEHEIWNLIPAYSSYNYSKRDKNMEEWYKEQEYYSEERLSKIYEWQEYAKNKWGK